MGISDTFKALADPQRRQILTMLRDGRLSAGEIAERLNITPQALSYHLRQMKQAGVVMEYREKNFIYYELDTGVIDELIMWLAGLGGQDNEKTDSADIGDASAADGGSGS